MEQVYPDVSKDVLESVKNFVDDLKSRIELYTNISTANINPQEYEKLNEIIKEKTRRQASELKLEDLYLFKYDEMEQILNIVCPNQEERQDYLSKYNMNLYLVKESKDETKKAQSQIFFETIKKKISDYILEYSSRTKEESEHTQGKIDKFRNYVELFTTPSLNRYMTEEEFNNLDKDLKTFGLLETDINNILIYINNLNIKLSKDKKVNPTILNRIVKLGKEYLIDNDKAVDEATKIIAEGFDPDELEIVATAKAKELDIPIYLLNNTIATLVANSLYHEYQKMYTNGEDTKEIESNIDCMLSQVMYVDPFVLDAEQILLLNNKLIEEYKDQASDFVDMKATDIESETGNINLKTLPILMSMKETVLNIKTKDRKSNEYYDLRDLLKELIDTYESQMNRLETIKTNNILQFKVVDQKAKEFSRREKAA